MRVLVVEDEPKIAAFIKKGLEEELYVVDVASDGEQALELAFTSEYDIIVLDILLPKGDGLHVCRELRREGIRTPVLMLTAKDTVDDRAMGLDSGARVNDIGSTQRVISSSLTAVDLRGLTTLELAFAVLMLSGATGLVLALGLAERRRTFAILSALGAKSSQLGSFLWSEGLLILLGGTVMGVALGYGVAQMLVKILAGVFDPPPEAMSVPWAYLALLCVAALASTIIAVLGARVASRRSVIESLRDI